MITCRRATELISRELDAHLPLSQRVRLGFHKLLCGACRRFRRQLGAVDEAVGAFLEDSAGPLATLSATTRNLLRAMIAARLEENS